MSLTVYLYTIAIVMVFRIIFTPFLDYSKMNDPSIKVMRVTISIFVLMYTIVLIGTHVH